jgi:predicted Zn-dependent protease
VRRLVVLIALALAALVSCGPSSSTVIQRKQLTRAMPMALETTQPWEKDPRPLRVRVWVDDDFRAQNIHWKAQLEEQFDEANQFLAPALGVRLDIVAYKPWEARSTDRSVGEILDALELLDNGDDVTWVIGYGSSLSNVSTNFDQIGIARPLGKHLVVRGYADVSERRNFTEAFPDTSTEEREVVHQARRRHKQTVVLIHELMHTLGAIHELDEGWLMHASYNIHMRQLSDRSRELAQIVIDERLKPASEQNLRDLAGRMVSYLDSNPWGGWEEDDKNRTAVFLRATMDSLPTGPGTGGSAPDLPVPPEVYDQFKRAQRLAAAGKTAEALAELEALVAAYPSTAEIRQAICEVNIASHGPGSDQAKAACGRAAEITPDDPRPFVARVEAFVRAGDKTQAIELLAEVEKRAGENPQVWDRVAEIYQATGRITQAEAAALKSMKASKSSSHPLLEWTARTRARYGLPPNARKFKIAQADEGEYIAAVRELLDLIYAGKIRQAQAQARAAEKRWKGAPGILGARCDLHLRQNEVATAKRLCAQAIAAWPGAAWAHYLEGVIALQEHKDAGAETSLRAAIGADPELGQAYRALAKALVRQKKDAEWSTLAEQYAQKFGQALPK